VSQARCRYFLLLRRGALFEKVKSTQINPVRLGDRVAFCVASRANDGARRIRHGGLETKGSGRRTGPPAGRRRAPLASSAARRGRTSAWWVPLTGVTGSVLARLSYRSPSDDDHEAEIEVTAHSDSLRVAAPMSTRPQIAVRGGRITAAINRGLRGMGLYCPRQWPVQRWRNAPGHHDETAHSSRAVPLPRADLP